MQNLLLHEQGDPEREWVCPVRGRPSLRNANHPSPGPTPLSCNNRLSACVGYDNGRSDPCKEPSRLVDITMHTMQSRSTPIRVGVASNSAARYTLHVRRERS
jgi:hypothetical protein